MTRYDSAALAVGWDGCWLLVVGCCGCCGCCCCCCCCCCGCGCGCDCVLVCSYIVMLRFSWWFFPSATVTTRIMCFFFGGIPAYFLRQIDWGRKPIHLGRIPINFQTHPSKNGVDFVFNFWHWKTGFDEMVLTRCSLNVSSNNTFYIRLFFWGWHYLIGVVIWFPGVYSMQKSHFNKAFLRELVAKSPGISTHFYFPLLLGGGASQCLV